MQILSHFRSVLHRNDTPKSLALQGKFRTYQVPMSRVLASAFWTRANNYFNTCGITVLRAQTDNGSPYRSMLFAQTLGSITRKRTRPYRPQTNGKVERFNRALA